MPHDATIEKKFERAFTKASGVNPVFPFLAKNEMSQMVETICRTHKKIQIRLETNQSPAIKGGFVAEEHHAGTFNLDSIYKERGSRAYTDLDTAEWTRQGFRVNDTPDIIVVEGGQTVTTVQSKYYATTDATAAKLSELKYEKIDQLLGPSDQVNPTDGSYSVADQASPEAAGRVTDTVQHADVSSTPLTKEEANHMGSGDLSKLEKVEREYQTKSTVKHMGKAAAGAAAMSAIVCGTTNTVRYIQLARDGQISAEEATYKIIAETASSAADSAIKASANAGIQSLIVRYGAEKAVVSTLARQSVGAMLRTSAVTVGVVCTVDAIKDMVALGMGKISKEQFYERQGKGMLNTSAGVTGGAVGALGAEAGCLALGASTVPALVPILGGLAGGLIAGIAMMIAIENGIERPYRELLSNTDDLNNAAAEFQRMADNVFAGQVLFTKILAVEGELDKKIDGKMADVDAAGHKALESILGI